MRLRLLSLVAAGAAAALALPGCPEPAQGVRARGQTQLTLLHTSDLHSRLFPYALQVTQTDAALGLGVAGEVTTVGGAARLAWLVGRERARSDRVLHIDGGDCFQGAPVFNFFDGEAEVRAFSLMGVDAQSLANHEFDKGALNARQQFHRWATYPVLAANYRLAEPGTLGSPDLDDVLTPFSIHNVRGLKVGVVGMGNLSSLSSLFEQPNRLGITPLDTVDVAQAYIDLLRPLVDLVVFVTHLGLGADEEMIQQTTGIDVVLGGHNHIVLQPPKVVEDCARVDAGGRHFIELVGPEGGEPVRRYCHPRSVVLAHSGAFAKYLGRLDLVASDAPADLPSTYQPVDGFEVIAHDYRLFPVTADLPQDPRVVELLEPYRNQLDLLVDLDLLVGYAPEGSPRIGSGGGDSPLGNLVAAAMWRRLGVETDFALTNTTGIRADLVPGPVTLEQMFNVFPFDNSITRMQLSGVEVTELFDFVARRSASRGCSTQVQIAGARVVLNCSACEDAPATACGVDADCLSRSCEDGRCAAGIACAADGDCPSNRCQEGRCAPGACAQRIYIGTSQRTCRADADCAPAGTTADVTGACDTARPDEQGRGLCRVPIDPTGSYELATSTYLAQGGSGFVVLKRNTTQLDTKIQQRDAMVDWVRGGEPCGFDAARDTVDGLAPCSTDADCAGVGAGFACACRENAAQDASGQCRSEGDCGGQGRCVLARCRQEVADFWERSCRDAAAPQVIASCSTSVTKCQLGGEQCRFLACIDADLGSVADGRIRMVGR